MTTFEYGHIKKRGNYLEERFLIKLASSLAKDLRPVWIMDRGYQRASLLRFCRLNNYLYIIRGRRDVTVEYREKEKVCRKSLGRLKHRQGKAKRYSGALYQGKSKEKVDIIVYREKGFKEPWFLLVPAFSKRLLPTELVVEWYRVRMNIETSFPDFKSLALMAITDTFLFNNCNLTKVLVNCLKKLRQNQVFVSPLLG